MIPPHHFLACLLLYFNYFQQSVGKIDALIVPSFSSKKGMHQIGLWNG